MSSYANHVVICGYDPGAAMLLDALVEEINPSEHQLVIFADGQRPPDLAPLFVWISGDPTKESELDKVRLAHAAAVVIVGSRTISPQHADAVTILTAFTIRSHLKKHQQAKRRKKPLFIAAEILDAENVAHASAAGADEVIETTRLGFSLLAHAVAMPGSAAVMSRVASSGAHNLYIGPVPTDQPTPVAFGELAHRVKESTGALVIGIREASTGQDQLSPSDTRTVTADDELIYLAEKPVLS